jgi:hypothetical protein
VTNPGAHEWLRPQQGTDTIPRGTLVRDLDSDRVGVLQDVRLYAPSYEPPGSTVTPKLTAFLRPVGGGCEWTARPDRLRPEPAS